MKKIFIGICFILLLFGCFEQNNVSEAEQNVAIQFSKPASIDVGSAICRVSADDMDTIRVALNVTPTLISGTIPHVPYGNDRLFEIMCFNSSGLMNYYGFSIIDINSRAPVVDIVLNQVDTFATVTINGRFGDTEGTEDKIVFVADWSGTYDTYIMDSDGSNIKQLTSTPYNDNCPKISPDRQKVVYQRQSEVGHQGFIVDVNTLEETMLPLVDYYPHTLSWNPAGDKLIFTSWINGYSDIFEYDMEMDTVKCLIADSACIWGARYTTDGENIIYHSDISGTFRDYIADLDGSNPQMLSTYENVEERTVHMHPTNSNLFVFVGRGYTPTSYSQWGIFILDRESGIVQNVISTSMIDETRPAWSPDGSRIVYEQFDGNNRELFLINPDGTGNRGLVNTTGNVRYPDWR